MIPASSFPHSVPIFFNLKLASHYFISAVVIDGLSTLRPGTRRQLR